MQSDNKIENPSKGNAAQKNSSDDLSRPRPRWLPRTLFDAIGPISLFVIVLGGVAAFYAYHYVTKDSVRLQFWVGFMFSLLAFVVLLVQSVIYAQQAQFMKQQSRAMKDSVDRTDTIIEKMQEQLATMRDEADAAIASAKAAWKAIDSAERLAIYAQRAYVSAKIESVSQQGLLIKLLIENAGNSPANNVHLSYSVRFGDAEPDGLDADFENHRRIGLLTHKIFWRENIECECEESEMPPDWQPMFDKLFEFNYYCWGRITYEDMFEVKRFTLFAFTISRPGGTHLIEIEPCRAGNEAI